MGIKTLEALGIGISDDVARVQAELTELRRLFHQRPELGNAEEQTQRLILEKLADNGIEAKPLGGTGVVGLIQGKKPGKVLLLRADMDALPIEEETSLAYKSENKGVMHACGHDAHMAMLITTAQILAERGLERGTVKLMFQPAEEGLGGALKMIGDGILEDPKVDAALAFHVWITHALGNVVARDGPVAAGVNGFKITIRGKGTHAAMPENGVDPIAIAAQIITTAQSLVTRRFGPLEPVLLSFTSVHGGSAFNVIPETAEILGTFRSFDKRIKEQLQNDIKVLASSIAGSFGGNAEYTSLVENIPVLNDPKIASLVRTAAAQVVGRERIKESDPLMVSEDFGEVIHAVPGALVLLGCGNPQSGTDHPHHHACFNIDERVLPIGVEIGLGVVERFLKET